MINPIRSNFAINIKQNSQSSRNTSPQIQPQLKSDSISFSGKPLKPEAISLLSEHAADWWATKLQVPNFDIGGPESENTLAEIGASLTHETPLTEKITQFKTALKESIAKIIGDGGERFKTFGMKLGVDYEPDSILSEALLKAGITDDITALPWKTSMLINTTNIKVTDGLNTSQKVIYELPEELKP